jgi:hypothetical protein
MAGGAMNLAPTNSGHSGSIGASMSTPDEVNRRGDAFINGALSIDPTLSNAANDVPTSTSG